MHVSVNIISNSLLIHARSFIQHHLWISQINMTLINKIQIFNSIFIFHLTINLNISDKNIFFDWYKWSFFFSNINLVTKFILVSIIQNNHIYWISWLMSVFDWMSKKMTKIHLLLLIHHYISKALNKPN
jgi:hypothetical protein